MRFAFGDRIRSRSEALRRERWRRYLEHLATSRIDLTNPAISALVGDVLHDSTVTLSVDSRTGDATLAGRNIFRIDRESKAGRTAAAPLCLRFRDCRHLTFRRVGVEATYYQSELRGVGDARLGIRIAMKRLEAGLDWIVVDCSTVEVGSAIPLKAGIDFPTLASIEHALRANEA